MFRSQTIFSGNLVWLATALLLIGETASARDAMIDINLNLREGPGLPHRVVLVMPSGTTVKVENAVANGAKSNIVAIPATSVVPSSTGVIHLGR